MLRKPAPEKGFKVFLRPSGPVYLFIRWEAKKKKKKPIEEGRNKENKKALSLAKYDKMVWIKDTVWLLVEQLSRGR